MKRLIKPSVVVLEIWGVVVQRVLEVKLCCTCQKCGTEESR